MIGRLRLEEWKKLNQTWIFCFVFVVMGWEFSSRRWQQHNGKLCGGEEMRWDVWCDCFQFFMLKKKSSAADGSDMNWDDGVERGFWFIFGFRFQVASFVSCAINSYEVAGVRIAKRLVGRKLLWVRKGEIQWNLLCLSLSPAGISHHRRNTFGIMELKKNELIQWKSIFFFKFNLDFFVWF